jgi:hypothetical protein
MAGAGGQRMERKPLSGTSADAQKSKLLEFPATALFNGLHVPQDMTESVRLAAEAVR